MTTMLALVLLSATVCSAAALASPRVPADLSLLTTSQLMARNDATCSNRTRSCLDCNHVTVCAYVGSGYTYLYTNTCPDSAPFCVNGECSKEAEDCQLPPVANDFTCTDGEEFQGYYPAPNDCTKYYVCSKGVAYVYNCPADHVYSQAERTCVLEGTDKTACYTFSCTSYPQYLLYRPDQAIYAVCARPGLTLVSRCHPNYRIDPTKPNEPCKPYCAREGRIPDMDNNSAYYNCNYVPSSTNETTEMPPCSSCAAPGKLSDPVKQFCPPGMIFHPDLAYCVTEERGEYQ